jgi:Macrocin-O-methyltransferase (TylF)
MLRESKMKKSFHLSFGIKVRIAQMIPQTLVNRFLLQFPFLYSTKIFNYESYIVEEGGIDDLIGQLSRVLSLSGGIVECGSARCGTSLIIAKFLRSKGSDKKVYSLDLFGGGLNHLELEEEKRRGLTDVPDSAFTYNSYEYVVEKIKKLGFSDTVIPIKGLLQDTLAGIDSKFCLSFIDCDLSKSVEYSAETIFPNMTSGGILLFDDYRSEFKGVKPTVDAFVKAHRNQIEDCGLLNRLYFIQKKVVD